MKKKRLILPILITLILIIIIGSTYAAYTYTNTSSNKELLAGNIYLNYTGSTGINIQDALPGSDYSDYYEFTITGSNNYSKDIYYDVILLKGDLPSNKTESNRIKDEYLKFKLVEVNSNQETVLLTDISYSDISNKKLYVSTVPANTTNYSKTYRLYMTISDTLTIGTNSTYSIEEWSNAFASVKVKVTGDFTVRTADKMPTLAIDLVNENLVTYSVASAADFSGGLVAVNTDGTLYNETSSSEEIREYRYSGLNVNNYVFLDTNGDGKQDNNEMWRIVGIFKNSSDEWNLKLMRNTILTDDEIPETYTYNGSIFDLKYKVDEHTLAYYTTLTDIKHNDWTIAGLQYWLNANDEYGYYRTLGENIKNLIDDNYVYYLGNVKIDTEENLAGPPIVVYGEERGNNILGNKATWNGAIALLYPSDYGYSANNSYWNTNLYQYSSMAASTSWIYQITNEYLVEFFISPTLSSNHISCLLYGGYVSFLYSAAQVRPVINLKADTVIDLDHTGSETDPYLII